MDYELIKNIFKNKKVLITGDTGFKGSWLAIWLLEIGAKVYGFALPPVNNNDNYVICDLKNHIRHFNGDIRNFERLKQIVKKIQPEFVFHLAAQPLVIESYNDPLYTFETNIMGTVNILESIRMTDSVRVVLNVTSDKCYKNNNWVWGYRENDPMGGNDPYSASKGCSELTTFAYLQSFFNDSNCNLSSVRAGNVIGAGDWGKYRVIPDYFKAFLNKEVLEIRNPSATRPWQHVLEPLGGYLLLAAKMYNDSSLSGAWNFGPVDEMNYTVRELITEIKKTEKSVKISCVNDNENKPYEAKFLKLDISKALIELQWKPAINFHKAVQLTIEGYLSDINKSQPALINRQNTIKYYITQAFQN